MVTFSSLRPFDPLPFSPLASSSSSINPRIPSTLPRIQLGFLRIPPKGSPNVRFDRISELHHRLSYTARQRRRRGMLVRSEIARTGPSSSPRELPEFQLVPRIRGVCFYTVSAVSAIFLFTMMLVAHPFVMLFDRYRRRAHHLIAKAWAVLTVAPFYGIRFKGLENMPLADAPAVYVSNHRSFLDTYTLLTLGKSFKFISKASIFVIPIIGWAMFLMGVIPLHRMDSRSQLDCLKRCIDLVKKGASVFFFPEGTRSKDGKLGFFKKGAFSIAAKTGVLVVPITLMGTGEIMPPGEEGLLNPGMVEVVIHKPIKGSNAEALCREARNVIASTLVHHGYGVHHSD
ncbi:hypothetical protein QJS04_geneDACA018751 [Acorus gramineus]|uniref:Phospholipid/glycerol acyltransferase domain-containing protein n=1 Tax=Acorus gramineus TaxID=55184 RepID=A0AAV9ADX5_ACOGR|nr:hypothetical protein QJS04_geneDACA018751 [Acorus gramineus]